MTPDIMNLDEEVARIRRARTLLEGCRYDQTWMNKTTRDLEAQARLVERQTLSARGAIFVRMVRRGHPS
jgi:hypothetical protein